MTYQDGSYQAKAMGHSSDVVVSAKIQNNKIEKVKIDLGEESTPRTKEVIDKLAGQIISKQTSDLDVVTGATETSNATIRAMRKILKQAGNEVEEVRSVKDGVYKETVPSYGWRSMMSGEITFSNNKLTDINITEESDSKTSHWFSIAESKLIPQIIKHQSLDVDAVSGASVSSGAIKHLVEKAVVDAGGDSDDWHKPVEKSQKIIEKSGYDVLVVGLGGSGILSYCAAALSGAKVFGIEAGAEIGGNSVLTSGPMVVNSKIMSEKYNDGKDNIDAEDLYQTWIDYVGDTEKKDVIRVAIDQDGPALDYYIKNFGISFDGASFGAPAGFYPSFVRPDWTKEWTVYTPDDGKFYNAGEPVHLGQYKKALKKAVDMNEVNDFLLETKAEEFLLDDDKVVGVKAIARDGTTYKIYAKAVILASGGFVGNREMMNQVYGHTAQVFGTSLNNGTGIKMGQAIGGDTYALKTLPMIHISQVPNMIRDDSLTPDQKATLSALATTPDAKKIDISGNLLTSKDESGTQNSEITVGIAYAPGFKYYNAYTQKQLDEIKQTGLSEATSKSGVIILDQGGQPYKAGQPVQDLEKIIDEGIRTENIFAGTSKDLAKKLNMDEKALTAALGSNDEKYYLFEADGYAYATCGGLNVDKNMNVLRKDGSVIENVFAVGQDSEGVENVDNEAYTPWGGQAQAWTFVSGKIAGENAARVAKK